MVQRTGDAKAIPEELDMTIQMAERTVFKNVHAVLNRARPALHGQVKAKNQSRSKFSYNKLADTGDLLIDALRLELHSAHAETLERRRKSRTIVNHLVQDYISASADWREDVERKFLR